MRRYETIVIVNPDVGDEQREPVFDRVRELIPQQNGILVKIDNWGTKKLAYEIKKKVRGFYSRIDYCGSGPLVDEIERFFRIDDRVLKFMTIMQAEKVDPEHIQEEIAKAAALEESASRTAEAKAAALEESASQAAEAKPASSPVETAEVEAKPTDPAPAPAENNKEES
ncbi:MAG: 30S ribosomal protein S6 [Desulfobacterales bacterium]|nr:30S ribosomal protein S6 [Desulfobacterales bacterium]